MKNIYIFLYVVREQAAEEAGAVPHGCQCSNLFWPRHALASDEIKAEVSFRYGIDPNSDLM